MEDEPHECCQACLVNICERGRVLNVNWTENSNLFRARLYYKRSRIYLRKEHRKLLSDKIIIQCAQRHMVFEININLPKMPS